MLAISDQFSVFYSALSKKAIRNEEMLFPLRPKLHAMQEVAYIQSEECFLVLIECLRLRHFFGSRLWSQQMPKVFGDQRFTF